MFFVMLLLHESPLSAVGLMIGGSVILLLWIVSAIAGHTTRTRERRAEKERQEAERMQREIELRIRERELEIKQQEVRRIQLRNRGLLVSTLVTVAAYFLTHDVGVTTGAGAVSRILHKFLEDC